MNTTSEKSTDLKKNSLSKFESVCMAVFRTALLERFDKTRKMLQSTSDNLEVVVYLQKSLIEYINEIRADEMLRKFIS